VLLGLTALALLGHRAGAQPGEGAPVPDRDARPQADLDSESAEIRSSSWVVPSVHALGLMTGMRIGAAILWPEPFADTSLERIGESYERAYTTWPRWDSRRAFFEWDGDPWPVNAIGHGLFGSELFLRARTCGQGVLPALGFTALGSAVWEYGFEANAVPAAGIVFGELRYAGWKLASRMSHRTWRGVLRAVVDPFGEFERALGTPC
jgi:hypothetical protein